MPGGAVFNEGRRGGLSGEGLSAGRLLSEGLLKLGLEAGGGRLSLLSGYIDEIELFNPAYGLVKVRDRRELIVKHILDSLAPAGYIRGLSEKAPRGAETGARIADAGSGAGLPGIPLAVCMPDAEFTLIERMGRRAGFLLNTAAALGLPNVRVEEAEMEKLAAKTAGARGFDIIVFRAFRPLEPAILKGLFRLLAPGGALAAYKGRRETAEAEMARAAAAAEKGKGPSAGRWEILPLEVPFLDEERHLLVIRP
jgi:16S rRNA (guanine527-N7)-methyltransferase